MVMLFHNTTCSEILQVSFDERPADEPSKLDTSTTSRRYYQSTLAQPATQGRKRTKYVASE